MIQRIQTVYLLIVAGLFVALLFLPLVFLKTGGTLYSFNASGLFTTTQPAELVHPTWAVFILAATIVIVAFIAIFMFKKRVLQARICVFNALLIIGFCALFGFYVWQFGKSPEMPDMEITLRLWAAFPIVAFILNYLAIRNIGADEFLVRSLERIR